MESSAAGRFQWPPISTLIGGGTPHERLADAIVHQPTVQRMLRSYGMEGGWNILFHEDAQALITDRSTRKVLFVDSLQELACLNSVGHLFRFVYLLGRDDEALAEEAEDYGVTALLTCPDHWFDPL